MLEWKENGLSSESRTVCAAFVFRVEDGIEPLLGSLAFVGIMMSLLKLWQYCLDLSPEKMVSTE